jgi:hypothetical protein
VPWASTSIFEAHSLGIKAMEPKMNDAKFVPSRDDYKVNRLSFLVIYLWTMSSTIFFFLKGGGINIAALSFIFGFLHISFTAVMMYKFRSNRNYRKINKLLAVLLVAIFATIICLSFYAKNSVPVMAVMFAIYLFCNFVAMKVHESAMIVRN